METTTVTVTEQQSQTKSIEIIQNSADKFEELSLTKSIPEQSASEIVSKSAGEITEQSVNKPSRPKPPKTIKREESTLDVEQVKYFNNLIKVWWKGLPMLHDLNQTRIPMVLNGLVKAGQIDEVTAVTNKPLKGLKILDVGCGGGIMSETLAELGGTIIGLDAAPDLIKCAQLHAKDNKNITGNLTYVCDMIEDYSENNYNTFDVVIASETIQHVYSAEYFVECCVKALKPDGSLFITTINRTTKSWLMAIICYEYFLRIIPKGSHAWDKFVTPNEILKMIQANDCKKVQSGGFSYNTFTRQFKFQQDESVFYFFHALKNN